MRTLCPDSPYARIPLRISQATTECAGLLGGRPPLGASLPENLNLRYFATVRFATEPRLDVSVFVAPFEDLLAVRGRVNDLGLVWPSVHPSAPRMQASDLRSHLTERTLVALPEEDDIPDEQGEADLDDEPFGGKDGHKIGGTPRLVRQEPKLVEDIRGLLDDGFKLVAQFDFPDDQDALVEGDWPFGDGVFSLLGRPPFEAADWRWYWDL